MNQTVTQNLLRHLAHIRLPVPVASLFLALVASAVWVEASGAQEAWCTANPAACLCSDTFQSMKSTSARIPIVVYDRICVAGSNASSRSKSWAFCRARSSHGSRRHSGAAL